LIIHGEDFNTQLLSKILIVELKVDIIKKSLKKSKVKSKDLPMSIKGRGL